MCYYSEFCCCCGNRTGVRVIGIFGILFGIGGIISSIGTYVYCQNENVYEDFCEDHTNLRFFREKPVVKLILEISTELLSIVLNILLLYGLEKRKSGFLLPWMAMSMIGNIVSITVW